jgi:hypothetical protein
MKMSWVLADATELDPVYDIASLKKLGAFWGSWRTWRAYQTDHVICHDQQKAAELLRRNFQARCNFYLPSAMHVNLDRPEGVTLYAGEFVHDCTRQEEIVALHLAATTSDIVLLLGWDLTQLVVDEDRFAGHQAQHHRNLVTQALRDYDQVQWVVVDHPGELAPNLAKLDNVIVDTMDSVMKFAQD